MEFINEKTIKLDKVVNEIDRFVLKFVKILKKHVDYVIVSGYVAILFGRARATEDIDVFIEELTKEKLIAFYEDLKNKGYWCLNTEDINEMHSYLADGLAIRFALNGETIPNFEIKLAKRRLDREALDDTLTVITELGKIKVSSIEKQIAFKRYYLKSDKDLEDASHLEKLFKGHINTDKIGQYKEMIEREKA